MQGWVNSSIHRPVFKMKNEKWWKMTLFPNKIPKLSPPRILYALSACSREACVGEEFRSSALNITSMFSINNLSFVCNKTQNKRYSGTSAPLYRNYEHEKSFELHLRQNILYWHKHSRSVSWRISSDHHIAECESLFFHHMDIFLEFL